MAAQRHTAATEGRTDLKSGTAVVTLVSDGEAINETGCAAIPAAKVARTNESFEAIFSLLEVLQKPLKAERKCKPAPFDPLAASASVFRS
jgi:hypothetical protein